MRDRQRRESERLDTLARSKPFPAYVSPDNDDTDSDSDFYRSARWRSLRYQAFKRYGRVCALCRRTPGAHGVVLHVDHIKPRSRHRELQWAIDNLQILCEDCNLGKGAADSTRWR